jgi:cytochrome b pre-mRNA-processing protein 3
MGLLGIDVTALLRRRFGGASLERRGYELYTAAVGAARDPHFYDAMQVPDTLDGRFDMVGLFSFLLIKRLTTGNEAQPRVAQAVFDAMFNDMDVNLREMGVGDMSIGKKVRAMWEAFHGRSAAYAEAMQIGPEALAASLQRNLWRGEAEGAAMFQNAANLARLAYAQDAHLARISVPHLVAEARASRPVFLTVAEVFA